MNCQAKKLTNVINGEKAIPIKSYHNILVLPYVVTWKYFWDGKHLINFRSKWNLGNCFNIFSDDPLCISWNQTWDQVVSKYEMYDTRISDHF